MLGRIENPRSLGGDGFFSGGAGAEGLLLEFEAGGRVVAATKGGDGAGDGEEGFEGGGG